MAGDTTLSGTPEGGPEPSASGETGETPASGTSAAADVSEPVLIAADDPTPPAAVPPASMFPPTMHDGSSASETGRTVPVRPLESEGGELGPCDGPDGSEDQALILGPPDATGGELAPVAEAADGTTAPALAADMVEGTNLFGDRAAMWSGDPSEVRAGYGIDPPYAEICLCDEVGLMAGAEAPGLAS